MDSSHFVKFALALSTVKVLVDNCFLLKSHFIPPYSVWSLDQQHWLQQGSHWKYRISGSPRPIN